MGEPKFKNLFKDLATKKSSQEKKLNVANKNLQDKSEVELLIKKINQKIEKDPESAKKIAMIIEELIQSDAGVQKKKSSSAPQ